MISERQRITGVFASGLAAQSESGRGTRTSTEYVFKRENKLPEHETRSASATEMTTVIYQG